MVSWSQVSQSPSSGALASSPLANRWRCCHYFTTCFVSLSLQPSIKLYDGKNTQNKKVNLEEIEGEQLHVIGRCFRLQDGDNRSQRESIWGRWSGYLAKAEGDPPSGHSRRFKLWCSSLWSVTCSIGSLETTWRTLTSLSWRSGSGEVSLALASSHRKRKEARSL